MTRYAIQRVATKAYLVISIEGSHWQADEKQATTWPHMSQAIMAGIERVGKGVKWEAVPVER